MTTIDASAQKYCQTCATNSAALWSVGYVSPCRTQVLCTFLKQHMATNNPHARVTRLSHMRTKWLAGRWGSPASPTAARNAATDEAGPIASKLWPPKEDHSPLRLLYVDPRP